MDLELEEKHILITGGSKGIGLACAAGFLREGARLTIVSRSQGHLNSALTSLQQIAPGGGQRVAVVAADLTDAAAAVEALDRAEHSGGVVDILINCAGAARRTAPEDLTPQAWHDAMQGKYFSYIHMIDPAIKRMAKRGQGVIINVIGNGGKVADPIHLAGGAANAALMLASAGLAAAYARNGVRVNAVNPGPTATERLKERIATEAERSQITIEDALQAASRRIPLGRIAEPEEIANAVLFLASARASYITGAILAMDGAMTPMV